VVVGRDGVLRMGAGFSSRDRLLRMGAGFSSRYRLLGSRASSASDRQEGRDLSHQGRSDTGGI
jgi:hypothetical protein